jgi:hypothetical protein
MAAPKGVGHRRRRPFLLQNEAFWGVPQWGAMMLMMDPL